MTVPRLIVSNEENWNDVIAAACVTATAAAWGGSVAGQLAFMFFAFFSSRT